MKLLKYIINSIIGVNIACLAFASYASSALDDEQTGRGTSSTASNYSNFSTTSALSGKTIPASVIREYIRRNMAVIGKSGVDLSNITAGAKPKEALSQAVDILSNQYKASQDELDSAKLKEAKLLAALKDAKSEARVWKWVSVGAVAVIVVGGIMILRGGINVKGGLSAAAVTPISLVSAGGVETLTSTVSLSFWERFLSYFLSR